MELLIFLAVAAVFGGIAWVQSVYLPRRRRERAQAWLDIVDDPATLRVKTFSRTKSRGRSSDGDRISYVGARAQLSPPWNDLTVVIAAYPEHMPEGVTPIRMDDPREVHPMWLWVSDPTCQERLRELGFTRSLRRFLMGEDDTRTTLDGMVQVERLSSECDPLGLANLQSEVGSVLTLLDQM